VQDVSLRYGSGPERQWAIALRVNADAREITDRSGADAAEEDDPVTTRTPEGPLLMREVRASVTCTGSDETHCRGALAPTHTRGSLRPNATGKRNGPPRRAPRLDSYGRP